MPLKKPRDRYDEAWECYDEPSYCYAKPREHYDGARECYDEPAYRYESRG